MFTPESNPVRYGRAKHNEGNAYRGLGESEPTSANKAEYFAKAITAYEAALRVRTISKFPLDYANTTYDLAITRGIVFQHGGSISNLREAIAGFKDVLRVHTRNRYPQRYALAQANLGYSLLLLSDHENRVENLRKAVAAFEEFFNVNEFAAGSEQRRMAEANMKVALGRLGNHR